MKKIVFILVCLILFSTSEMYGQEYNAINYWKMEHDSEYGRLLKKQTEGKECYTGNNRRSG